MERHFDEELGKLKQMLTGMCDRAERMIQEAIKALLNRDETALKAVAEHENEVNRMQMEVDEACLRLIALFQPTASDLRFLLGAVKTNTDLERLADLAVNISHKAKRLIRLQGKAEMAAIPEMADLAAAMARDSLKSFVRMDTALAKEVIMRDEKLNRLKSEVGKLSIDLMRRDPGSVDWAVDVLRVSRNLERIGDHAKNIAENTIFVSEGRDVRHPFPVA